jgi:hypothetical protein
LPRAKPPKKESSETAPPSNETFTTAEPVATIEVAALVGDVAEVAGENTNLPEETAATETPVATAENPQS